jgi:nucleotide-binding universal stress UspA family protein
MPTIVYTTDLAHDDHAAFEHSVALASAGRARLVSLHANGPEDAATKMPEAADLLKKWGREPSSVEFDKKVHSCCLEPLETLLDGIRRIGPDLVVTATHKRSAFARFIAGSGAEAIAGNVTMPTLLLPVEVRGFVESDGQIDLRRILVPVGDGEEVDAALKAAAWLAELAGIEEAEFALLHVGDPVEPAVDALAGHAGWSVRHESVGSGSVESAILERAKEACVLVMATRGHDSVGDVVHGSHTERVLHQTHCPILAVKV